LLFGEGKIADSKTMIGHAAFDATEGKMLIKNADLNSRLFFENWGYVNYFRYIYVYNIYINI